MNDELTLHFSDEAFEPVLSDADNTLQRLIANMMAKGSAEGILTIKIDIELVQDMVDNFDPSIPGKQRMVKIPKLSHKVSSMLQIKDEAKGGKMYDGYELVWDETSGEYVMRPIVTAQQTIWDDEYVVVHGEDGNEQRETPLLEKHKEDDRDDWKEGPSPFNYLLQFVGQQMQVCEAMGNYTVRARKDGMGSQTVLLSSAFRPMDRFFCSAEKLKPHVGHTVECVACERGETSSISIVCKTCGEVLFSVNADESGKTASEEDGGHDNDSNSEEASSPAEDGGEPEDMTDAFGDYPYENPVR